MSDTATATAASARGMMDNASLQVQERSRGALAAAKQSSLVQRYVISPGIWLQNKFNNSPTMVKVTFTTFGVLSCVPLACFSGFMGVVTVGCLIVGGIAFTIVEGGFAMFASAFLLPALGFVLLITGALGLFGLTIYGIYRVGASVIGMIWGPGQSQEVQHAVEHGAETVARLAEQPLRTHE